MEIQIPSPSVFLRPSPVLTATLPTPVKKLSKSRNTIPTKPPATLSTSTSVKATGASSIGISKPKQSKSRNGCITCKAKRLKCDETKPTCVQCAKRSVECGGYRKDFKWKIFEETSTCTRVGKGKRGSNTEAKIKDYDERSRPSGRTTSHSNGNAPWPSDPRLQYAFDSAAQAFPAPSATAHPIASTSPPRHFSPSQFEPLSILNGHNPSDLDLPSPLRFPQSQLPHEDNGTHEHSSFSSGSPTLVDLLLPGTDLHLAPDPSELRPPMSPSPYQPGSAEPTIEDGRATQEEDEEVDEEIIRDPADARFMEEPTYQQFRAASPTVSEASSTFSRSTGLSILRAPATDVASSEALIWRFTNNTCGILSVKDGPNENPWRNLIWPLARDSPALFHAITSMTALHGATNPQNAVQLRHAGVAHMHASIRMLSEELQNMRLEQALATSLALALGEGWDEKISTGIQHLKGAKELLRKAIAQRDFNLRRGQFTHADAQRLKFLCNTFVYMDVIARLTSSEQQENLDYEYYLQTVNEPFDDTTFEVDPLMGCATTLFPLIGKVATLIQRLLMTPVNSLAVISEATHLRDQLLHWQPPDVSFVETPEDPETNVRHAIQTAEAYRQAILLHLHQAVPEIHSEPLHDSAKRILTVLASVPLRSQTLIVQILPLLVGSCEMVSPDDRQWVRDRWEAMIKRLAIVNVQSCWNVVQEVWRRRDEDHHRRSAELSNLEQQMATGPFVPPGLKRKMPTAEALSEAAFFDTFGDDVALDRNSDARPSKRRMTFDNLTSFAGRLPRGHPLSIQRRHAGMCISSIEPEYTVRGNLHWLGVMRQRGWEVFLG